MKNILKFSLLFFLFFFIKVHYSMGQDSLEVLTNSWLKLNTQLQRRTDITITLVSIISKSKLADKDISEKLKSTALDLLRFIDPTRHPDSVVVQVTCQKNTSLTQALSKALVLLLDDSKFKAQEELRNLQTQLEGMENRVAAATRNYNNICVERKRPDLLFDNNQTKKSP
jgi:LemA protein